jgi:hypothetical protein
MKREEYHKMIAELPNRPIPNYQGGNEYENQ